MSPERVRRVTVADRTRMESGLATGASWWVVKRIPRRTAEWQGEMVSARRGPSTESRWKSPQ
ncbi:hypothetical protein D3C85_1432060 [compost metagenome]